MSTQQPGVIPHVSWLKKFGHAVASVLGWLNQHAGPIEHDAAVVAEIALPQFAPEIMVADNLASRILSQVKVTEAAFSVTNQATNGPAKLQAVLTSIGPEIDAWVANNFPGAKQVSTTAKAGVVNAIVALANDIDASMVPPVVTQAAVAAAAATVAAVNAASK
jgi:hypothetical protein